mgnify:CR=1 FL=1|jgi:hypothetical protein
MLRPPCCNKRPSSFLHTSNSTQIQIHLKPFTYIPLYYTFYNIIKPFYSTLHTQLILQLLKAARTCGGIEHSQVRRTSPWQLLKVDSLLTIAAVSMHAALLAQTCGMQAKRSAVEFLDRSPTDPSLPPLPLHSSWCAFGTALDDMECDVMMWIGLSDLSYCHHRPIAQIRLVN